MTKLIIKNERLSLSVNNSIDSVYYSAIEENSENKNCIHIVILHAEFTNQWLFGLTPDLTIKVIKHIISIHFTCVDFSQLKFYLRYARKDYFDLRDKPWLLEPFERSEFQQIQVVVEEMEVSASHSKSLTNRFIKCFSKKPESSMGFILKLKNFLPANKTSEHILKPFLNDFLAAVQKVSTDE